MGLNYATLSEHLSSSAVFVWDPCCSSVLCVVLLCEGPSWFTTTYAISAYHHWCCGFDSRSGRGVLDTTFCGKVCQGRQVGGFLRVLRLPPPIKLTATI